MSHDSGDVPDFWSAWENEFNETPEEEKSIGEAAQDAMDEYEEKKREEAVEEFVDLLRSTPEPEPEVVKPTDAEINQERRQAFEARVSAEEANTVSVEQQLAELRALIEQNKEVLSEINVELSAYDSKMETLDEQIKRLQDKKKALKEEKSKYESRRFDVSRSNRKVEDEIEALKRRLALEAAQREAAEKEALRRTTLDELTKNAPWRDRAKPHQLEGMHFITAAQRVICADQMGTGKTLQSIMCVGGWEAMGDSNGKQLIFARGDQCESFMLECDKWDPERLVINVANIGTQGTLDTLAFYDSEIENGNEKGCTVLINYEILPRSKAVVDELVAWQFSDVIADEAHILKNTNSGTFKAVKKIVHSHNSCPICGELCMPTHPSGRMDLPNTRLVTCPAHGDVRGERSVKNYMSMTGTPILNKPEEIFASLHLCHDEIFANLNTFRYEYCWKDLSGHWRWTTGGESRLVNKIKGMYIRRTTEDAGIVLPPQDIQVHDIQLDPKAYPLQSKLLSDLITYSQMEIKNGKAVSVRHLMALITRQRQATVWPGGITVKTYDPVLDIVEETPVGLEYQESQKLDWACDLMDEFDESGIRYVVFSQFREPLEELARRRGNTVVEFHGGTSHADRAEVIRNFDRELGEKPKWNGILAHYKLGGEGLNLTAVTQTIILDEQWSPGMNAQAYARSRRMGQTEETGVHIGRLVGKGSLDQWMAQLIEEKAKMLEGFETEITFAQLADLFNLAEGD